MKAAIILLLLVLNIYAQEDSSKVASQNPSPMVEFVRAHQRITPHLFSGLNFRIDGLLLKPVEIYIPKKSLKKINFDMLIHFHGEPSIVKYAADEYRNNIIALSINMGTGSKVYYDIFKNESDFERFADSVKMLVAARLNGKIKIKKIILSGFSAGYGAVKKILSFPECYDEVDAVLLLDGLHASYIPERKVVFDGGHIDSSAFSAFIKFGRDASKKNSDKRFLFTHSEIFPGTFVSTAEAAEYLTSSLRLKTEPVLKWGPLGMQQISEVRKNHFAVLGFAGNTAPDHIDHLHALYYFLNKLMM